MNKILWLAAALLLSACGFRPAGSDPALNPPLPYRVWAVEGGEMQQVLETELVRRQAQVDNASGEAVLKVAGLSARKDIRTLNLSGSISEYLLVLEVSVQVQRSGQAAGKPMTFTVQRPLDYSDRDILGKQEEEALLWAEMRADAAKQIVRRLGYLKAE